MGYYGYLKTFLVNLDIGKDTPFIEIEPFSTIYFLKIFLISKSITQDL